MRAHAVVAVLCASFLGPAAHAQAAPAVPVPCEGAPPAYPAVDGPPTFQVLYGDELGSRWAPPACTGWAPANVAFLVVAAARFRHPGDTTDILARFGAISQFHSILYWSHTRQAWRPLMPESFALTDADQLHKRPDFTPDEMTPGVVNHFWQSVSGKFAYKLVVRQRTPDRVVIDMENVSGFQMLFFPVFRPGDARLVYFIEREEGDVWRYYSLVGISAPFLPIVRTGEVSFINRAAAIFRFAAGIPTDRDPPAAPGEAR